MISPDPSATGTLYVVATPIGNLEDITLRALRVLGAVDLIAAEDTRVTVKLLARHGISTSLVSFREHNAHRAVPELIEVLRSGRDVALVTDAGTPSISDPGGELVRAVLSEGLRVTPIPGASALACAMSVAPVEGEGMRFVGFLPRSGRRRKERLQAIAVEPGVTVLYEAPSRLKQTLADLLHHCGPERGAVVLRELTKAHEEIAWARLDELTERFTGVVRGEITVAVEGKHAEGDEEITDERLGELVAAQLDKGLSARDAAAALSRALGVPKRRVYAAAVKTVADGDLGGSDEE